MVRLASKVTSSMPKQKNIITGVRSQTSKRSLSTSSFGFRRVSPSALPLSNRSKEGRVSSDAGVIDITDDVKRGADGHPTFKSVAKQSDELLHEIYEVMKGDSS
jgi:hypothetical protein